MTYAEIAAELRRIIRTLPVDWHLQILALADRLEADDAAGLEAIMRAVREKP